MQTQKFYPEGRLLNTEENRNFLKDLKSLKRAYYTQSVVEALAVTCDCQHNLIVDLNGTKGIIKRVDGAFGIDEGETRDIAIISRVNKPVCFKIKSFATDESGNDVVYLSRRDAQFECITQYINFLVPGDVVQARITHLDCFGCFVDIGAGISSLIPIDAISVSRISHPADRFKNNSDILAVVKAIDEKGRIILSHKELLGSWEENAAKFRAGETVSGIIRSVEEYGIFIELTPNLAGLAEPRENVAVGQKASIYIKSLIPQKMKIKLVAVDCFDDDKNDTKFCGFGNGNFEYCLDCVAKSPENCNKNILGHMEKWIYSPENCIKNVQTIFSSIVDNKTIVDV